MIYRNDDVCKGFDERRYSIVRGLFESFGLKEHYSVIPFGENVYTPDAHLLSKQELIDITGGGTVKDDEMADKFIRESIERGHEITLHGWTHVLITQYTKEEQFKNIKKARDFLESEYGVKIKYFVPPFNSYDDNTLSVCSELGLQILGRNKSQLEWLVIDNNEIMDEHCWYHAWRFFEGQLTPNKLKLWLQARNNQSKH